MSMMKKSKNGKKYPDLSLKTIKEIMSKTFKDDFDIEECTRKNLEELRKYQIDGGEN